MTDISATQYYFSVRNTCHRDVCQHLSALRKKIKVLSKNDSDSFWQQELDRVKREKDKEWGEKFKEIEEENRKMREQLERMNCPASVVDKGIQLDENENEIDKLNYLLSLKLITINKLQNELAHYSKIIFELEKAYALHCLKTAKRENHISSQ